MAYLDLTHLEKSFGTTKVVKDFSLGVEKGEFISFLGPSGCGKTTTLRMVAGFETPSAGDIAIGGQSVTHLKPNKRNIGMVFQSYALFPNLTVAGNVGFGLRIKGVAKSEIKARVAEMLSLIGLPDLGNRYPFQLSGGQQQRVALARALAPRPQVLLLDEPLSALDAKIRVALRDEIRAIQQKLGITTIYVTHDQEEALAVSDRIVVMNNGIADQIGTPFEIYNHPTTEFVARFVGTLNVFSAKALGQGRVDIHGQTVDLGRDFGAAGAALNLSLRPEMLSMRASEGRNVSLDATVSEVSFLGAVIRLKVRVGDQEVSFDQFNNSQVAPPKPGQPVTLYFAADDVQALG